jgi:hypothetical protein
VNQEMAIHAISPLRTSENKEEKKTMKTMSYLEQMILETGKVQRMVFAYATSKRLIVFEHEYPVRRLRRRI